MPAMMLGRSDIRVHQVAAHLVAEFDGAMPPDMIEHVVLAARRDLDGEVHPEALPEFLHRLAWQRLVDLHGDSLQRTIHVPSSRRRGPDE